MLGETNRSRYVKIHYTSGKLSVTRPRDITCVRWVFGYVSVMFLFQTAYNQITQSTRVNGLRVCITGAGKSIIAWCETNGISISDNI